jgi:uncharacterized protein YndB with AHSA1/START domain
MPKNVDLTFWTTAPVDQVWRHFTVPEQLSAWHGQAERFEARSGGRVRFADPGRDPVEGVVTRVWPQRLLTWRIPADRSEVVERFAAADGGTTVRVVHRGEDEDWPADGLAGRVRGWEESIADLVLLLDHGVSAARHMAGRGDPGMATEDVPAGLAIRSVAPGGAAEAAGLHAGDVLISFAGVPVYRRTDLSILLRGHGAGRTVPVEYVRDRAVHSAELTLG